MGEGWVSLVQRKGYRMKYFLKIVGICVLLSLLSGCGTAAYLAGAAVGTTAKAATYIV